MCYFVLDFSRYFRHRTAAVTLYGARAVSLETYRILTPRTARGRRAGGFWEVSTFRVRAIFAKFRELRTSKRFEASNYDFELLKKLFSFQYFYVCDRGETYFGGAKTVFKPRFFVFFNRIVLYIIDAIIMGLNARTLITCWSLILDYCLLTIIIPNNFFMIGCHILWKRNNC